MKICPIGYLTGMLFINGMHRTGIQPDEVITLDSISKVSDSIAQCKEEKCAWWDEMDERCVVKNLHSIG